MQANEFLKEQRNDQGLSIRAMTNKINENIPVPKYRITHTTLFNWEKGQTVDYFIMYYLANKATGFVHDVADKVVRLLDGQNV